MVLHWGPPAASFATWITDMGLSGDHAAAGANADPDGDGLPNGVEYVLGGNPGAPDASVRPAVASSGGNMVFTFSRDDASETPDVILTVETGADLVAWPMVFNIGPNTGASSLASASQKTDPPRTPSPSPSRKAPPRAGSPGLRR